MVETGDMRLPGHRHWRPEALTMFRRGLLLVAVLAVFAAFFLFPVKAHDLPLDRMMNAFVKIEPHQADLVIRVPLDLLRNVEFPLENGNYNVGASGPSVQAALQLLAGQLTLRENGAQLMVSSATGRLAPLSDRSFEDYDQAAAGVTQTLAPGTRIAFELGYLDVRFVYPISSPKSVFTIETTVAADLKDSTKLVMRYVPLDGSGRAMIIRGGTGRVFLNP